MDNNGDAIKEDLPYIFQLLESEDEVKASIATLERNISKIDNRKKRLNLAYHNQFHLLRNIVLAGLFSLIVTLLFHINYFFPFVLGLILFFGYDSYKKQTIKTHISDSDSEIEGIIIQKNNIEQQFYELVENDATFTSKLPEQFRDTHSVLLLFNYLYYGQADNLKEAYHLLDLEYRHQEVVGILREQSALMDENNQIAYEQLSQLQNLTSLQQQQLSEARELSSTARNINSTLERTDKRVEGLEERFVPKSRRRS